MNKDYKEDVWSGFADLLATLIEKYVVILDLNKKSII